MSRGTVKIRGYPRIFRNRFAQILNSFDQFSSQIDNYFDERIDMVK